MKQERSRRSVELAEHIPEIVTRLLRRIESDPHERIALLGFSEAMKWIYRLLAEAGRPPLLCDWRPEFVGYDCSGGTVVHIDRIRSLDDPLLVLCVDDVNAIKSGVRHLIENRFDDVATIYEVAEPYEPYDQEEPYRTIATRARARAQSMIADDKLFNLIQYIKCTTGIDGEVVEFGTFNGGSSAMIVEAVNHYGVRPVALLDSFEGIPRSRYGLDYRWTGSFSNNSYAEVKAAFSDCPHVRVIKGNFVETHKAITGRVSFCHIAVDTLEASHTLLDAVWPRLSPGGIIVVDDYGSFPNAIPLTVAADRFAESHPDAFAFLLHWTGMFLMKRHGSP